MTETKPTLNQKIEWRKYFPLKKPRPQQEKIIEFALDQFVNKDKRFVIIEAGTGCHRKGQKILLSNGEIKLVENIKVGDFLLGMDGTPRKVLSLIRGHGKMAKVKPIKGNEFVVNIDHILTLIKTTKSDIKNYKNGEIVDVSVNEWLNWNKKQKHLYKLFHSEKIEFNVEKQEKLLIDPYFLGILLGDGSVKNSCSVTSMDKEIVEELYSQSKIHNVDVTINDKINKTSKAKCYYFRKKDSKNNLIECLKKIGIYNQLSNNKFIPNLYKTTSIENRKQLLAGLIDTDGSLSNNCFDYISKSKQLSEDVCFVSRSLGLRATISNCYKSSQNGTKGLYYRVCISGNIEIIPTRLPRKQASVRKQKKNSLRTGFTIELINETEDYFGFIVDGDNRYLLDDFLITHNCGKSHSAITIAKSIEMAKYPGVKSEKSYQKGAWVLTTQKILQNQYIKDFGIPTAELCDLKSSSNYSCDYFQKNSCQESLKLLKISDKNTNFYKSCMFNCKYRAARKLFLSNNQSLSNFSYFLTASSFDSNGDIKPRELLICDEAHTLEEQLEKHIEVSITELFTINYLDIKFIDDKKIKNQKKVVDWIKTSFFEALTKKIEEVNEEILELVSASKEDSDEYRRLENNFEKLSSYSSKLTMFFTIYSDDNWTYNIVETPKSGIKIEFKSIDVGKYAEDCLFKYGKKILLMSATILNKDAFCESIGIMPSEAAFISVDSAFDETKSPIVYIPTGKMSKEYIDTTLPVMAEVINELLDTHKDEKGIIHTHNYKICQYLMSNVKNPNKKRLITHESNDRDEKINEFISSKKPLVLISPSSTEGLDLKDDLSRFQIICKIPFPFLGDELVKLRMKKYKLWYNYQAAKTIVQSRGRSIRNEEDYAITYILDESWDYFYEKNNSLFPEYFKKALKDL